MPVNIKELMQRANRIAEVTEGNTTGGTSKMSISVVYHRNGKHIILSKKLSEALNLTDVAHISFVIEDGIVLLAKYLSDSDDDRIVLKLNDEKDNIKETVTGKKIAYNADAAYVVANSFNLDYSKSSSKSFDKIEIDRSNPDNPIAVIQIMAV